MAPWERLETGTFEVLLQAGAIWQSDMGGPNSLTWGMPILFCPLEFQKRLWRCQLFLANPTSKMVPTEVIHLHIATRFAVMMNFQQISSLTRQVQEHKDWATFLDWLPQQGAINLFSLLRRCRMLPGDLAKFTKCQ